MIDKPFAHPLVSVIVCVFNGEKFLAATLKSVFEQTYSNFELIVIDDGSSDGSTDVISGFCDPRLRLLRQKNQGAAVAFDRGFRSARGEYVAFLDQDDLWERDKLAAHVSCMQKQLEIELTFSWFRFVDKEARDIGPRSIRYRGTIDFRNLLRDNVIGATSNAVARRAAIEKVGGVDTAFPRMYDWDLFLRIAFLAPHVVKAIPRDLMLYRRHGQQQTSDDLPVLEREWDRVMDKMRRLAPAEVSVVEPFARSNASRFFARLAYERCDYHRAVKYVRQGFFCSPGLFLADPRNWLTAAACLSGVLLPAKLHLRLERLAGYQRL